MFATVLSCPVRGWHEAMKIARDTDSCDGDLNGLTVKDATDHFARREVFLLGESESKVVFRAVAEGEVRG